MIFFALLALGRWQLQRAHLKTSLLKQMESVSHRPPLRLSELPADLSGVKYQSLQVSGYWDMKHQFLVMNQFYRHQLGFHVITPFYLVKPGMLNVEPSKVLLVHRGWIAKNNLMALNSPVVVGEKVKITGIIDLPPKWQFILGVNYWPEAQWPLRFQKIDFQEMSKALHANLYPFILRLRHDAEASFVTDWQPLVISPARHIAYAVQWFGLAMVWLIGFITLHTRRLSNETR